MPHESPKKKPVCEQACGKVLSKCERAIGVPVTISANVSTGEGMSVGVGTS